VFFVFLAISTFFLHIIYDRSLKGGTHTTHYVEICQGEDEEEEEEEEGGYTDSQLALRILGSRVRPLRAIGFLSLALDIP